MIGDIELTVVGDVGTVREAKFNSVLVITNWLLL